MSFHPSGERLVTGALSDPWIRIHDYETGAQIGVGPPRQTANEELIKGHHGPVHCVAYAPNGFLFATGSEVRSLFGLLTNLGRNCETA